jgi:AbrB family looped-hinge helix DNA binding protein
VKTRVSSKGQVVLPQPIRTALGLVAGSELEVVVDGDQVILRRPSRFRRVTLEEAVGCAGYDGPPRSVEEMNAGLAAMLRERGART